MADLTINTSQLIANDIGSGLRVTAVSQPTKGGSLVFNGTTIEYTAGANQQDDFTYTVTDQWGFTSTAKVSVTVKKTGAVTAVADTFDYPQDYGDCAKITANDDSFRLVLDPVAARDDEIELVAAPVPDFVYFPFDWIMANDLGQNIDIIALKQEPNLEFDFDRANRVLGLKPPRASGEFLPFDMFEYTIANPIGITSSARVMINIFSPRQGYDYTLSPAVSRYYVRGSVEITAHSNFSDIGFASNETFSILGYGYKNQSGQLRQDMEIVMAAINHGTDWLSGSIPPAEIAYLQRGVTAKVTAADGTPIDSDVMGYLTLYRDSAFTDAEVAGLPAKLFGTVSRGSTTGRRSLYISYNDLITADETVIDSISQYPNHGQVWLSNRGLVYEPDDPYSYPFDSFIFVRKNPNTGATSGHEIRINKPS